MWMGAVFQIWSLAVIFLSVTADPQDDAQVACVARILLTEQSGVIESLNYPLAYDNSVVCKWHLAPSNVPEGHIIFLELTVFRTDWFDYLTAYVGGSTAGDELFRIAGDYTGDILNTGESEVLLEFISDFSGVDQGFKIHYSLQESSPIQEQSKLACARSTRPLTLTNETGGIQSLDYPGNYPDRVSCQWYINPSEEVEGLYLTVIDFDSDDYLEIYEGSNCDGRPEQTWYYIMLPGTTVFIPGNEMFVNFPLPFYTSPGFDLVYYPVDPACMSGGGSVIEIGNGTDSDGDGVLSSPGYPHTVPEHLSCRWLIKAPEGQKVILYSEIIHLAEDPDCKMEYLEIIDGSSIEDLSLGKYCGNTNFGSLESSGNVIQVVLRTFESGPINNIGFSLIYDASDDSKKPWVQ